MRKGIIRALAILAVMSLVFHCSKKDPAGPVRDEIKPKGSISGVVYDKANHPLKDVIVSINSDSATPAISDAAGAFTVGNVLEGSYRLQFSRRDYEDDTTWTVDLAMGEDFALSDTVTLSYSYYTLSGKVVYNGAAVPGAGVSLAGLSVSTLTDAQGRYVLSKVEKGADLRVITAKTGFGFNIAGIASPVADDTTRVADIELDQEGGKVQGVVYDTAGNPVSGAVVTAVGGGLADTSNTDGSYTLSDVPAGEPGMRITIAGFSGLVGGIMGLDVSSGASLTGADIHLFVSAQMENGMAVVGSDLFVKDTAQSILLAVFPYADTSASIASYEWFFNGSSTADTTTSKPWLRMSKTALAAKYPAGTTNLAIQVRCVNRAGEFSATASFYVRIRAVVVRVSAQGTDSTKSAYSDTVRCSNRDTVYLKPNVSAVFAGIDTIKWDFGDNTPSSITLDSVVAVWHQYRLPGSYKAIVTVKDVAGTTARDSVLIVVSDSSITHSGSLTTESVWSPRNNPHKISGTYYVRGKLTILPGCIVQFLSGAKMIVGSGLYSETGTLVAQGTATDSIWFTSSSSAPSPGAWGELQFGSKTITAETKLQYCAIEYAVNGVYLNGGEISMDNCMVRKASGFGVNAYNTGFVSFTKNQIRDGESYPVRITAEYVRTLGVGNTFASNQQQAIRVGNDVTGDDQVSTSGTWLNHGIPYSIGDDIRISGSASPILTIVPGCTLAFSQSMSIAVGYSSSAMGALNAQGTVDSMIVFTAGGPTFSPGVWDGIGFTSYTIDLSTALKHCVVEYGANNLRISSASIAVDSCVLRKSGSHAVSVLTGPFRSFTGNRISESGGYAIRTDADGVRTLGVGNVFSANTQQAIRIENDVLGDEYVSVSGTWLNHGIPYSIGDVIYVGSSSSSILTIAPGCTLAFSPTKGLVVGYSSSLIGALNAQGSADSMIVFTADGPTPSAGSWNGLRFASYAIDLSTALKHCVVEYGANNLGVSSASIAVDSCVFRKSGSHAVSVQDGPFRSFTGNRVSESGGYAMRTDADGVSTFGAGNVFSANQQQAIRIENDVLADEYVSASGTWLNHGIPYSIGDVVYVGGSSSPILTIAPGCTLAFSPTKGLVVGYSSSLIGALNAQGSADSMIVFTADGPTPSAGSWNGLRFASYLIDLSTALKHCVVEYGTNNLSVSSASIAVDSCVFRKSGSHAVSVQDGPFRSFTGNRVSESGGYAIRMDADGVRTIGVGNVFSTNTQQAIRIENDVLADEYVTASGTWLNHGVPYSIGDDIQIGGSASPILTIAPGCTLAFSPTNGIEVGNSSTAPGALNAEGTPDSMIVFTADSPTPSAGGWDGLTFSSYTVDGSTRLSNCRIEFGGGNAKGNIYCVSSAPTIQDCVISNSSTYGIYRSSSTPVLSNNTFSNNASGDLY